MPSPDNIIFTESITTEDNVSAMIDKQYLYVNDNNNSSYSSQIVFDSTPLSNCGSYVSWMEAFLTIPLVLQIEAPAANLTLLTKLDFAVGLKNGFWNILHSLTCDFNGSNVIQQVNLINVFASFKNLTTWSPSDLKNWGAVCGFYPDSAPSWIYNNISIGGENMMSSSGTGLCNNRNAPYISISSFANTTDVLNPEGEVVGFTTTIVNTNDTTASCSSNDFRRQYNKGFAQRQAWLNYNITTNSNKIGDYTNNQAALFGTTANVNNYKQTFMTYIETAITGDSGCRTVVFDAIIRLKDITDFFGKCPLMKGGTMRLYLNTNQVYFTGSVFGGQLAEDGTMATAAALCLTSTPTILGGGGTCPVMVASADVGMGLYNLAPPYAFDAENVTFVPFRVGLSIVKTQFAQLRTQISAPITSCRLYAPCYTMSPVVESRYLAINATKKVIYTDVFQFRFPTIMAGSSYNILVSNGIPNMRGILIIPLLNQTCNGASPDPAIDGVITDTLLSPFSSTGGTPDPISITNFNILISGKNVFQNNMQYNYQMFLEQLVSSNQLNGSLTTSLGSGLIGYEDFTNLYRYYYANVSRHLPSEDGVPKSIQILGTNNSLQTIDLLIFVEFEKQVTLDLRTGQRIA